MLLLMIGMGGVKAQCAYNNTAFESGELLSYNLYFNWKFVWVKAGTASFSTIRTTYKGVPAYRGSLITRGSSGVDKFFILRDTLLCYNSLQLEPLYYRKGAREGDHYTVDELFYFYANGKCTIRQHRQHNDGTHTRKTMTYNDCVFDMMSIFMRARSFNAAGWSRGHIVNFPMADGNKRYPAKIRYDGVHRIKAENGHTYRCLKLSYLENEKGKGFKPLVDFYVTDDENHVPVRLDMHLRFGSAKAFLVGMRGVKNPITSRIK